jgi:hypothetical protein
MIGTLHRNLARISFPVGAALRRDKIVTMNIAILSRRKAAPTIVPANSSRFAARVRAHVSAMFLAAGITVSVSAANAPWKAGAAVVVINPDLPMWMSGYGNRTAPSNTIAVDLHAKALAIEDAAGNRVVLVTVDVLGIPRRLRETVGVRVQRQFGLPSEALLVNASHTHCGPELRAVDTALSHVDADREKKVAAFQSQLEHRLVEVVGRALAELAPAELAFARAKAGFAMNRRADFSLADGDPRRGKVPNPNGPVDHDVPVLQVKVAGKPSAVMFGYACHNTTSNQSIFHGDYAGFAQSALEQTFPGAIALFMAGCGGDQNPYPRQNSSPNRSGIDLAKLHGQTLALAVEAALATSPIVCSGPLRLGWETLELPYWKIPSEEELTQRARSAERGTREHAQVLLNLLKTEGRLPATCRYPVQVVQFGSQLTLIGLGSEAVVDFSLRLKKEIPGRAVWVAAYCNDFMGYIPSRRIWDEGGYEGGGALTYDSQTLYRALHPGIWSPEVEEIIISKTLALYQKVSASR